MGNNCLKTKSNQQNNASESQLFNMRDDMGHNRGKQPDVQEFIRNQNQLNKVLENLLNQYFYQEGPRISNEESMEKQGVRNQNGINNSSNQQNLIISNLESKQVMRHGIEFKELLDPRDRVLEHDFHFTVEIDYESIQSEGFIQSKTYQTIKSKIHEFLVETIANILSVSFQYLNSHQLEQKEVKNYAASNLMLNLQAVYSKTIEAIAAKLKDDTTLHQIKLQLLHEMQDILKTILNNQAAYYPQAPVSGGTLRMNDVINEINRVDDEENDLIYSNQIKISKYLKIQIKDEGKYYQYQSIQLGQDGNYTEFIMEVVNTAIRVVQTCDGDSRERINKEIFTEFNKEMFALSQIQSFKSMLQTASNNSQEAEAKVQKQDPFSKNVAQKQKQAEKQPKQTESEVICSYFQRIMQANAQKLNLLNSSIENSHISNQINKQREKKLQKLTDYATGFKIPNYVKQFNRQQIAEKHFRAKHSSVLRILTKWAEYLEDVFENAEKQVMLRLYSFKDVHNKLIQITDPDVKQKIIDRLKKEHIQVKEKLQLIRNRNLEIASQILTEGKGSLPYNVYRFTHTREVSTKVNAVLTSLMVEYISVLIHHLIKAGMQIRTNDNGFVGNINLIVFKVSDLMRAKFKCSQSTFISLLKTMYLLDESTEMKGKFKLVRIKNKLQQPANNIMVNYLFMGKVLCQLQLSIQESKGKEKNYYIFSHLIYELMRGKFGAISECAIMISQLDPIASSSNDIYYTEKNLKQKVVEQVLRQSERKQKPKREETIFYCISCKELAINQNLNISKDQKLKECRKCFFLQEQMSKEIMQNIFELLPEQKRRIFDKIPQRITNYKQIDQLKPAFYLRVNSTGEKQLVAVVFAKEEFRRFLIKVNPLILKKVAENGESIDFSKEVDYLSIQKLIKDQKQIKDHYLFNFQLGRNQSTEKVIEKLRFEPQNFSENVQKFVKQFLDFRKQKNLIKSIKFKAQILNFNSDSQKWECFNRILKAYANQDNSKTKDAKAGLKYKKYKQLTFNKIKIIQAVSAKANDDIPQQIAVCINLQQLRITKNEYLMNSDFMRNIKNIRNLDLSENLLFNVDGLGNLTTVDTLCLRKNRLESIDGLRNAKSVSILDLSLNELQNVDVLQNFTNLRKLILSCNKIQNIDCLINLTSIETLDLSHNNLKNTDGLRNLRTIHTLDITGNQLLNIAGLRNVTSITNLQLSRNQLPNADGLKHFTSINTLGLGSNSLKNIDGLENVLINYKLDLSGNQQLQNINGLKNMRNIDTLDLRRIKLQNVDALINLTSVSALYLTDNQLQNLDGLRSLSTINIIDLANNKLQNLDGIQNVSVLNQLYLRQNPQLLLEYLPSSSTITQIRAEYQQLKNIDFEFLPALRMLLTDKEHPRTLYKNLAPGVYISRL